MKWNSRFISQRAIVIDRSNPSRHNKPCRTHIKEPCLCCGTVKRLACFRLLFGCYAQVNHFLLKSDVIWNLTGFEAFIELAIEGNVEECLYTGCPFPLRFKNVVSQLGQFDSIETYLDQAK